MSYSHGASRVILIRFPLQRQTEFTFTILTVTDMSSQLVNLNLGYGNKAIGDAIKEQVDKFCFVGPSYATEAKSTLAEMIINLLPDSFGKVFFTNAGADANENAVKIARMFTGRNKVFSRYRSYHGSSFGAGSIDKWLIYWLFRV